MDSDELPALVTPRTRLLIFNSPHNPTGGSVLTRPTWRRSPTSPSSTTSWSWPTRSTAASSTRASTISIAALPGMAERTIVLDGFSKTYAMTGWRLGLRDPAAARSCPSSAG